MPLKYVRDTGRMIHTRYKEHKKVILTNKQYSGYAQHILNTGHTCGSLTETMEVICTTKKKGSYLNALENYCIYELANKLGIYLIANMTSSTN
jgi:hypothetical protein